MGKRWDRRTSQRKRKSHTALAVSGPATQVRRQRLDESTIYHDESLAALQAQTQALLAELHMTDETAGERARQWELAEQHRQYALWQQAEWRRLNPASLSSKHPRPWSPKPSATTTRQPADSSPKLAGPGAATPGPTTAGDRGASRRNQRSTSRRPRLTRHTR